MRSLLCILLCLCGLGSYAQEDRALYVFERHQMELLNTNTLDELLQYMPFVQIFYTGQGDQAQLGRSPLAISTVYMDGVPLFMDHVQSIHYSDISLMGIQRVELRQAGRDRRTKFLGPYVIHLYSETIHDRPAAVRFEGMLNARSDALFGASGTTSTARHSFGVGFQRYYVNALAEGERAYGLPVKSTSTVGVRYHGRFYGSSSLHLQYRMNNNEALLRGPVFPQTARAEDLFTTHLDHRFQTGLDIRLSRTHRLELKTMHIRSDRHRDFFDVDLSNGRREPRPLGSATDSTANGYSFVSAWLSRQDSSQKANFAVGIEYSRQQDINYQSIEAISISYVDYAIIPSFDYAEDGLQVSGSLRFLSHSVLGNAIMPRFRIAYEPSDWKVSLDFIQSVFYPLNAQLFYPRDRTGFPYDNNLELDMGRMQHVHLLAAWNGKRTSWRVGTSIFNLNSAAQVDPLLERVESRTAQSGLFTFIAHTGTYGGLQVQGLMGLSGGTELVDVNIEDRLTPEGNLLLTYSLVPERMELNMAYRYLGPTTRFTQNNWQQQQFSLGRRSLFTVALSRELMAQRMWLSAGMEHILERSSAGKGSSIDPTRYGDNVLTGRGRAFFVRLRLDLS